MASSTSNDLKLELITTGEKSGTWGTITNTNLQILEQAASGYFTQNIGSADLALALSTCRKPSSGRTAANYLGKQKLLARRTLSVELLVYIEKKYLADLN